MHSLSALRFQGPRDISFDESVAEFTELFHTICKEQAGDRTVLLPLSGGLDSRTQAVAREKVEEQHAMEKMVMGMEELYYDVLAGFHAEDAEFDAECAEGK